MALWTALRDVRRPDRAVKGIPRSRRTWPPPRGVPSHWNCRGKVWRAVTRVNTRKKGPPAVAREGGRADGLDCPAERGSKKEQRRDTAWPERRLTQGKAAMNNLEFLLPFFVNRDAVAPEFDLKFYYTCQPDLRYLDEDGLCAHYVNHGRSEGRLGSPAAHRYGFIAQIPCGESETILEIGPAVRPCLTGANVHYFDIADREGLLKRASAEGYSPATCPEKIDYVSPTGDLSIVSDRFDKIFSSHCIEHQPDLVKHLADVSLLLKPNGRYFLLIPDKRYCFDALLPPSTFDQVKAAHAERRKTHPLATVVEHYTSTTHNDPARHWSGDNIDHDDTRSREERTATAIDVYEKAAGGYVDVHAWQFTPDSFLAIVNDAFEAYPAIELEVEVVYHTMFGLNEFGAVLRGNSRTKKAPPSRS